MQKKRKIITGWFEKYTKSFILESEDLQKNIELKKEHSLRVRDEIVYLAEKTGMPQEDTALAEITAILHDVGRFEQFNKFRTFSDRHSVNHAELGVKIIQENQLLSNFESESENIILKSILYHNRQFLPEDDNHRVLFFSKLLRDADKIDIWKVVLDYYTERERVQNKTIELDLPDTAGISPEVFNAIMNHRVVNMADVQNLNDFKVLQAGWVFDLNFKPSFERIIAREYISRLKSELPQDEKVTAVFLEVEKYLHSINPSTQL